jgi:hypothetical protein
MKALIVTVLVMMLAAVASPSVAEEVTGTFAAPVDRVWTTAQSLLKSLGWDIEKSDRTIGWITTESRRIEGEDYGVYAKGLRHRLRVTMKEANGGRTLVGVERSLFKRERILWIDKDEPLTTTDRSVERDFLAALGRAL